MKCRLRTLRFIALIGMSLVVSVSSRAQNRQIRAWGYDGYGQLGNGGNSSNTPVMVPMLTSVAQVAAGTSHSVALISNGTVYAWGTDMSGWLGNGITRNSNVPTQVWSLSSIIQVAAGESHSIALKSDGTVWAWGDNQLGEVGAGGSESHIPMKITSLSGITQIVAGQLHSLAIKSDGTVWAWGWNVFGQLGDGHNSNGGPTQVYGLTNIIHVAGGGRHSLAVKSDGTVWAWGENFYGQLGDGTNYDSNTPVQVSGLYDVIQVAAGNSHSLAIKSDGTVWAWGYNYSGELGDGTHGDSNTPVRVLNINGITQISGGVSHSLALKQDGTVYAWGHNAKGQLGDGSNISSSTPLTVLGYHEAIQIAGGAEYSLALHRAPTIYMSDLTLKYGQRSRLLARLYNPVLQTGILGVTVTFAIDGTTVGTATTTDNGSGLTYAQVNPYTISDSLTAGTHTLIASYDGSNGLDPANSKAVTLTVAQTETSMRGSNASGTVGDTTALRGWLSRTTDLGLLNNQPVKFFIDGNYVAQATTNSSGLASLSYEIQPLGAGTHTLLVQYDATTNYKASSVTGTLTISKANTTLAANNATKSRGQVAALSARLVNVRNSGYVVGRTVTFKIDSTAVGTGTTGADGYARYSYSVPSNATVGAHTITAVFAGDTSYNTSTGSATLTVN